jgi:hypothetical protein
MGTHMQDEHDGRAADRAPDHRWPITPGPQGPDETARLIAMTDEVARRLRGACLGMPPAAFDALVREIALTRWRWDARRRRGE